MTTLDKMLQGLANALGASLSTLTTTAKTVVGAINELKSGQTSTNTTVSSHTSTIGSGTLNTTNKTLIGAVNELQALVPITDTLHTQTTTVSKVYDTTTKQLVTITPDRWALLYWHHYIYYYSSGSSTPTNFSSGKVTVSPAVVTGSGTSSSVSGTGFMVLQPNTTYTFTFGSTGSSSGTVYIEYSYVRIV